MQYLSVDELAKLKKELKMRQEVLRLRIGRQIDAAKEFGDLPENGEYDAAKNEQFFNEGRIAELREMVNNSTIVQQSRPSTRRKRVKIGSVLKIAINGKKQTLDITGSQESAPAKGKVSHVSPLGKALLRHHAGDKVKIKTPNGEMVCEIIEIK